ncbi:MAG TPA: oxidoreductase, partial [Thermomicrobiales bacterium]|nr:oxidoreductase [Thermomicrobiales bacterium]
MSKVFFITGVSSGFGRAFATAALKAGHTVVGTLRHAEQIATFEALAPGRAYGVLLDITDTDRIREVIADAEEVAGPIDVLVNNAGYGVEGIFEEIPLDVFRQQFETNVFGTIAVTQAALPSMRNRRSGQIIFITSMGGLRTFPGISPYHGTKYALEGLAGSLRDEVAPLGITVTIIEPGSFRTDWAGRSLTRVERSIPDYDPIMDPIRESRRQMDGHQLGNPEMAALALLTIVENPNPPAHLVLGTDARRLIAQARA